MFFDHAYNDVVAIRPGIASIFIPNCGIAHECITSAEVTVTNILFATGKYICVSVFNNLFNTVSSDIIEFISLNEK